MAKYALTISFGGSAAYSIELEATTLAAADVEARAMMALPEIVKDDDGSKTVYKTERIAVWKLESMSSPGSPATGGVGQFRSPQPAPLQRTTR